MRENKIDILSTKELDPSLIGQAGQKGFQIDMIPFISLEPANDPGLRQTVQNLCDQSIPVIFTSVQAVRLASKYIEQKNPSWKIFCLGLATRKAVEAAFENAQIAATAPSAAELAKKIIQDGSAKELVFFCGDQRRDELPSLLATHRIPVKEVILYHTLPRNEAITKNYHGILFFSPSGVKSLFAANSISPATVLFAIGPTTAEEIKKISSNTLIVSDQPEAEALIQKMTSYFQTHPVALGHS